MLKRRIIIGLISIFLILICYAVIPKLVYANPDDITLYPVADANLRQELPTTNYGDSTVFQATSLNGSRNRRGVLKFDLSSLPEGVEITSATLRFYCNFINDLIEGVTDVEARRVADDSWTEMSVTWANQKDYSVVEDTQVPVVDTWINWTVTGYIQNEWAGDETVSFTMKCVDEDYDASNHMSGYYTKEYNGLDPELYIEYTSLDSAPTYSDVGYDDETQVGESADFWVFWEDDFALETCKFSTNNTGIWKNDTLTVSGISSWANKTLQLNHTSSVRINYQWFCSDNASQWSNTSIYFLITTPLYIIFNFNNSTMGKFKVDNIDTANETQNSYNYNESILLDGIPLSSDYVFNNFTWTGGNSIINNYNYTTEGNNTVWCYFDIAEIGGIHEDYFVLGFVIAGCAVLFMVIVLKSDKKEK